MVILVVDSVRMVLRNLERLLSCYRHEVITAESGEQALELLKQDQRVNLVITELQLGDMTAIDLFKSSQAIERISDHGQLAPPEFILFTHVRPDADAFSTDVRLLNEALDLGFLDVLFKPLVREKLLRHIDACESSGSRKFDPEAPQKDDDNDSRTVRTVDDELRRLDRQHQDLETKFERLHRDQKDMRNQLVEIRSVLAVFSSTVPTPAQEDQKV